MALYLAWRAGVRSDAAGRKVRTAAILELFVALSLIIGHLLNQQML
jgi:hypothetical protein